MGFGRWNSLLSPSINVMCHREQQKVTWTLCPITFPPLRVSVLAAQGPDRVCLRSETLWY